MPSCAGHMDGSGRGADHFSSQEERWDTNASPRSSGLCSAFSGMELCWSGTTWVLFLETGQSAVPGCPASPAVLQKAAGPNWGEERFGFYTFLKFIYLGRSAPSTSSVWHLFSKWTAYAELPISALGVRDTEACILSSVRIWVGHAFAVSTPSFADMHPWTYWTVSQFQRRLQGRDSFMLIPSDVDPFLL